MINLDDVQDGVKELERAARLGLAGAMITEYPLEHGRYDQSEYEPFWATAAALDMPLSLHTATRRQGRIRGAGDRTLRDASSRATKAFYPALSALDHGLHVPRASRRGDLPVQGPALAKAGDGMLPSDFFRRNVVLSFQKDAIGIRLRDVIGVDNMMWGSDYPHSESRFPRSRRILAEMLEEPTSLQINELGVPALLTQAARFRFWLDVEAALAGRRPRWASSPRPPPRNSAWRT